MSLSESDARGQAQRRDIGLLFDAELNSGGLSAEFLRGPALRRAVRFSGFPSRPWRMVQQLLCGRGGIDFERPVSGAPFAAGREVLSQSTAVPPSFLVGVDEFSHYRVLDDPARFGTPGFERLHKITAGAGKPDRIARWEDFQSAVRRSG